MNCVWLIGESFSWHQLLCLECLFWTAFVACFPSTNSSWSQVLFCFCFVSFCFVFGGLEGWIGGSIWFHHGIIIRRGIFRRKLARQKAGWQDKEIGSLVKCLYTCSLSVLNKRIFGLGVTFFLVVNSLWVGFSIICKQSILTDISTHGGNTLSRFILSYQLVVWKLALWFQLLSASFKYYFFLRWERVSPWF